LLPIYYQHDLCKKVKIMMSTILQKGANYEIINLWNESI